MKLSESLCLKKTQPNQQSPLSPYKKQNKTPTETTQTIHLPLTENQTKKE